jgi:hypothetical protein
MQVLKSILGFLLFTVIGNWLLKKIPAKLAENAVTGWADNALADALGISAPQASTVLTFLWEWGVPGGGAVLLVYLWHLWFSHEPKALRSTTSQPPPSEKGLDVARPAPTARADKDSREEIGHVRIMYDQSGGRTSVIYKTSAIKIASAERDPAGITVLGPLIVKVVFYSNVGPVDSYVQDVTNLLLPPTGPGPIVFELENNEVFVSLRFDPMSAISILGSSKEYKISFFKRSDIRAKKSIPVVPTHGNLENERSYKQSLDWNFDGLLGGTVSGSGHYISKIWIEGVNCGDNVIPIRRASIISLISGKTKDMQLRTDKGYVAPDQANPVPPGAKIYLHSLFYEPSVAKIPEGIAARDFLLEWGSFRFSIDYTDNLQQTSWSKVFDYNDIKGRVDAMNPLPQPTPRVTRRET